MRVLLTGGRGFVGSQCAHVFSARHETEVVTPGRDEVDVTEGPLRSRALGAIRPDAVAHAAIWNDAARLASEPRRAWRTYVGATANVVDAPNRTELLGLDAMLARPRLEMEDSWAVHR